ncbi:hypothetical protein [Vibrio sp. 10N.261.55.A7]|uniref:hypothetical protein n=1 Tax=Vibrio sp. 10N.261.55.A7 TaxID=1880851 RepID=UPI000C841D45|nr:hypothetical protein [Vibrio sp. 10N.261.55.A7]PMJ98145.1 hypothetical protein BCU12_04375 [Vibrio sp. 10N.261.55.A7]
MEQRFALLLQAEVISQKAHDNCLHALRLLDSELGLSHDNEQYQMALTHLSRAADRIWQGEEIEEGLDADILSEIYDDPESDTVLALHRKTLNAMDLNHVSTNEEGFLIANAYALFQLSKSQEMSV